MRSLRRPGDLDFGIYLRGVGMLFKAPVLVVPIVGAQLIMSFVFGNTTGTFGMGGGIVFSLLAQLVHGFGLAIALIGADLVWRDQPARLAEMFEKARRRGGDLLWATFAFYFALFVASAVGGFLVSPFGMTGYTDYAVALLDAVAIFFVIYTFPAAANGGIPGQAAINVSFVQARAQPLPTLVVTFVYVLMNNILPIFIVPWVLGEIMTPFPQLAQYDIVVRVVEAVAIGILATYPAIVLAKVYNDLATRRFFFGY